MNFAKAPTTKKKTNMKLITTISVFLALSLTFTTTQGAVRKLSKEKLSGIDSLVKEEIEKGNIPGAVILIGQGEKILYRKAFGHRSIKPRKHVMNKNTVFDIASLTKPIATATSIMILIDRKKIQLTDYAGRYLPAFACNGKGEVQIKHLLAHTSGLPAYTNANELKEQFGSPCRDKVIEKICSLKALSKPGENFRYSCLGYITLAKIVETITSETIDVFARKNIFAPLKMKKTTYNPANSWKRNMAAAEVVGGQVLRGTVHDPLARLMAGKSGNAGLFSTADDLSIYCRMLLNNGTLKNTRILSPQTVALLTTAQSHNRACGFDVNSSYSWVKGDYAPENAFCHTGYTGTSIVCDPMDKVYIIILTNRIHPNDKGTTRPIRTKVADIVFQAYEEKESTQ